MVLKKSAEEGGWGAPVRFGKDISSKARILSGTGMPKNTDGNEGDWYLDKETKKTLWPQD